MKIRLFFLFPQHFFFITWSIAIIILTCQHTFAQQCYNLSRDGDPQNLGFFMPQATVESKDIIHKAVIIANERAQRTSLPDQLQVTLSDIALALVTNIEALATGGEGTLFALLKQINGLDLFRSTLQKQMEENIRAVGIILNEGEFVLKLVNNPYESIDFSQVILSNDAYTLLKKAEGAKNNENIYRRTQGNNEFSNQYIAPEHILLAFINLDFSNPIRDFFFNSYSSPPTLTERWLGDFLNRFSANIRQADTVNRMLYKSIAEVRGENNKNGVREENPQYPLVNYTSFHSQIKEQGTVTVKDREISYTKNLNKEVKTNYILTEQVGENLQKLMTAIGHKGVIEIFGEPFSGRRTTVYILADLINATHDPQHPYHKQALELIPEHLKDTSIHALEESLYTETHLRGADSDKFTRLSEELLDYEGRAILFADGLNRLLRNTNTDSHETNTGTTNLISVLREDISDGNIILILVTNKTQQAQITKTSEDIFLNRQTINIPTLTQQQILEYVRPLANDKNTVHGKQLFASEQLDTLINRAIYIAGQYPALTGVGIEGAKKVLNAIFDNTRVKDIKDMQSDRDIYYHVDQIVSQVFSNGTMDIGLHLQSRLNIAKIKENIEKFFIPPNPNMLDTFISRMIHTTSRVAPHVEILLGPPGTGKTTFINALGLAFQREVILIEGSKLKTDEDIIGDGPDSLISKIRAVKGPAIIYINEANLVVSSLFQTNSPFIHLESLFENGRITDINGNELYVQNHSFFLDMNLSNQEGFNQWKEKNPDATKTQINFQLASLIRDELKIRDASMSRIINGENIHPFERLNKENMENIITLRLENKKNELVEETGISFIFEKSAIELLARHAIENAGMGNYGARPILNRIDHIINRSKAELGELRELGRFVSNSRIPENTEIQITTNNQEHQERLIIIIKTGEEIIREVQYDLNEGEISLY